MLPCRLASSEQVQPSCEGLVCTDRPRRAGACRNSGYLHALLSVSACQLSLARLCVQLLALTLAEYAGGQPVRPVPEALHDMHDVGLLQSARAAIAGVLTRANAICTSCTVLSPDNLYRPK